ncbi:unnamed protein product, partial [Polarella glacialis]
VEGCLQAKPLKTSGAFHTKFMMPAREKLLLALREIESTMKPPTCEVYMNLTGQKIAAGTPPAEIIDMMGDQLTSCVLWEPSIKLMIKDGITVWLHPVHQRPYGQVAAWMQAVNREHALGALATRAAFGLTLSVIDYDVAEVEQAPSQSSLQSLMRQSTSLKVLLNKHDVLALSSAVTPCSTQPEVRLSMPLVFADVRWARVPLESQSRMSSKVPQYVIAIAPRPVKEKTHFFLPSAAEDGESAESVADPNLISLDEVLLIVLGGFSQTQFRSFLFELGCRGAIRWDLEECYKIPKKALGSGGCGAVYLGQSRFPLEASQARPVATLSAEDVAATMQVAVKRLYLNQKLNDESQVRTEINLLASCRNHPNITCLFGVFCSREEEKHGNKGEGRGAPPRPPRWAIVMELCSCGDLHDYLVFKEKLPEGEGLELGCGILAALAYLHIQGVVHRDVKAENVLLGQKKQAILADLGIAAQLSDRVAMKNNVGSPGYAAPEIVSGKPYGLKVDLFSTGVLFYFMFTGHLPFSGSDVQATLRRTARCKVRFSAPAFAYISGATVVLMQRLLSKEPEFRPPSTKSYDVCWHLVSPEGKQRLEVTHKALKGVLQEVPDELKGLEGLLSNPGTPSNLKPQSSKSNPTASTALQPGKPSAPADGLLPPDQVDSRKLLLRLPSDEEVATPAVSPSECQPEEAVLRAQTLGAPKRPVVEGVDQISCRTPIPPNAPSGARGFRGVIRRLVSVVRGHGSEDLAVAAALSYQKDPESATASTLPPMTADFNMPVVACEPLPAPPAAPRPGGLFRRGQSAMARLV